MLTLSLFVLKSLDDDINTFISDVVTTKVELLDLHALEHLDVAWREVGVEGRHGEK